MRVSNRLPSRLQQKAISIACIGVGTIGKPELDLDCRRSTCGAVLPVVGLFVAGLVEQVSATDVKMGRMHSKGKGMSSSALPYKRTPPSWCKTTSTEVGSRLCRLLRRVTQQLSEPRAAIIQGGLLKGPTLQRQLQPGMPHAVS